MVRLVIAINVWRSDDRSSLWCDATPPAQGGVQILGSKEFSMRNLGTTGHVWHPVMSSLDFPVCVLEKAAG